MREAEIEDGSVSPSVSSSQAQGGVVIIVKDAHAIAEIVARKVQEKGYQPELVDLPEAEESLVEQMFTQALSKTDQPLAGFIHIAQFAPNIKNTEKTPLPVEEIRDQKTVFLCAKYFTRLYNDDDTGRGFFISAVRLDGRLGLVAGGSIMQGGLFGLHKSLGIEWQGRILSKAIDLAKDLPPETAANYLLEEIFDTGYSHAEIGRHSDGKRYAPYLTESYPDVNMRDNGPESSDVLLITGGGRGVTAKCVIRLAQSHPCGLIILGRTDLAADIEWAHGAENWVRERNELRKLAMGKLSHAAPKPSEVEKLVDQALNQIDVLDTLDVLRQAGARVRYVSCDVQDHERLKEQLQACEAELGPITGLVHGAGNIADKRIQRKTAEDFDNVFGSKVAGLDACLRCIEADRLKYVILFSSIAGYFGNTGQCDYAMANEVLNKFAYTFKKEHPACKVISVNWGMWDGGSMVSESLRNAVKGSEIQFIPIDTGSSYFVEQFIYPQKPGECQIVINNTDRLIRPDSISAFASKDSV